MPMMDADRAKPLNKEVASLVENEPSGEPGDSKRDNAAHKHVSLKEETWKKKKIEPGKRTYDREFLLKMQFHPASMVKPEGLPDIEVIMDKPRKPPELGVALQRGRIPTGGCSLQREAFVEGGTRISIETRIFDAVREGDLDTVSTLLDEGADVNSRDRWEGTLLLVAAEKGYLEIVNTLIHRGANVKSRDEQETAEIDSSPGDWTPLHVAAGNGHLKIVEKLVDAGADLNSGNKTPLHKAVQNGRVGVVNSLLKAGADLNPGDEVERTPLFYAVFYEQLDILKTLIGAGADVNSRTKDGRTPLHCAVQKGDVEFVRELIDAGADVNLRAEKDKKTPLHWAAQTGDVECLNRLIAAGADVTLRDLKEWTPLHFVAHKGYVKFVNILKDAGADINSRAKHELTPLYCAAQRGHVQLANELIDAGADVNSRTENKWTPLHYAARNGHVKFVKKLIDAGADVNAKTEDESTSLHFASFRGHIDVVNALIGAKADLNVQTQEGKTSLQLAEEKGQLEVVKTLLHAGAHLHSEGTEEMGVTNIQLAAVEGDLENLTKLLNAGADANFGKPNGQTLLHLAALMGHSMVVNKLLEEGADSNARGWNGRTPLHVAANSGHFEIVRSLMVAGADLKARDKYGVTPFSLAAKMRHLNILDTLHDAGADVNIGDNFDRTPLHMAVKEGALNVVKKLIDARASVNVVDKFGVTPLILASKTKHYEIERALRSAIARRSVKDDPATKDPTVPMEIVARGPEALRAYRKALKDGKTHDRRVPVMIVGQDRSGKTSLKKSLKGERFDPEEDSTQGIEVDPSLFQSTTEVWRPRESGESLDVKPLERKIDDVTASYMRRILSKDSSEEVTDETDAQSDEPQIDESASFDAQQIDHAVSGSSKFLNASTAPDSDQSTLGEDSTLPESTPEDVPSFPESRSEEAPKFPQTKSLENIVTIPKEILQRVVSDEETIETDDDIELVLWDFAGQSVFYTTHMLFLSRIAIYILTHDLTQKLDDKAVAMVKCDMYERTVTDTKCETTNMDYIHYWLSSIHSFSSHSESPGSESEHLSSKLPPVFLVCTHADKCSRPRQVAMEILPNLEGKSYQKHVVGKIFTVNNTRSGSQEGEDEEVKKLRPAVIETARELPHMKELFPVNWLRLETILKSVQNTRFTTLDVVREKAQEVCDVQEENDFRTVINFLHDRHAVLHFSEPPELDQLVVLDRQWLINVFKKVITVQPFECQDEAFRSHWKELEREGVLHLELVKHVWKELIPANKTVSSLLLMLEKFSLICRWILPDGSQVYLVPSMLMSEADSRVLDWMSSAEIPVLVVRFPDQYLPFGLFSRLVIRCANWCSKEWPVRNQPKLRKNCARFFLGTDGSYQVILVARLNVISVSVVRGKKVADMSDADHKSNLVTFCRAVCTFVKDALQAMQEEHLWMRFMSYTLCVECPVCSKGGVRIGDCDLHLVPGCKRDQCLHYITEDELVHGPEILVCSESDDATNVDFCKQQFTPWFEDLDIKVEKKTEQERPVSNIPDLKVLNDLSGEIIHVWQSLGRRLGVREATIDNIMLNNVSYPEPKQKAFEVLKSWRNKGSTSTFMQLAQALKEEDLGLLAEQYCG